jgi:hypothetical protein
MAPASEIPPPPTLAPNGNLPPLEAVVVDPGDQVVVLGMLDDTEQAEEKAVLVRHLAASGTNDVAVVYAGVAALVVGSCLVVLAAFRRRRPV